MIKEVLHVKVVRLLNKLPQEFVDPTSLEVFKARQMGLREA